MVGRFTFQAPANILFEPGASRKVAELVTAYGGQRVMLVTDKGVRAAGLTADAERSLREADIAVTVFEDVQADPPSHVIETAVGACRDGRIELVLSIGGGSALDTAKLVAYLARSPDRLDDIYGIGLAKGQRLPLLLVPTTAGTGSEVTPIAIVTTPTTDKKGVVSPVLIPDWAILDPELTLGLPPPVTAATGIDAMVHAIEAYTSKVRKNPMSDQLARQALALLSGNIRRVCENGRDLEARANMLLGSMLAGMAFANAPVAAVHALAYPIGAIFHVPHGLSNALVLPQVLRFNLPAAESMMSGRFAARIISAARSSATRCATGISIGWIWTIGIAATSSPAMSSGSSRCTGPGRSSIATRNASRTSVGMLDALTIWRDSFVNGRIEPITSTI
jgi:alcohol dehydrogenase class IV